MMYDVIIVGAGPGGIFSAYELVQKKPGVKIAVFEAGNPLSKRHCPIDGEKVKTCIGCKTCAIMSGFGGAGAFSDGKYNITNDFGGTLYEHIGKKTALDLMKYVDEINVSHGGENTRMFSTAGTKFKKLCIQNKLKLLDASVRHLGTDINYVVLENLYNELKEQVDFFFLTPVTSVEYNDSMYTLHYGKNETATCKQCIISVGRSGSKWMETVCKDLQIPTKSNFALLVSKHFSEPFKDSNGYGESIARLSNMLGGGVIVQRFGDLVRGRRSTVSRIEEGLVRPTLSATPGDLSLVLPKRILDGIIEMIYALDKIAPGTANDDTLLYGVEVKFYNMEVDIDEHLESPYKGLYIIGDGSGVTHSLSHASASGVYVARRIAETL